MRLKQSTSRKGRGAQIKLDNPFDHTVASTDIDQIWYDEAGVLDQTKVISVQPKSIVNKVSSPDVGLEYSLNPYQGCEHGCVYCYARPTHNYWGYGAGLDFESKILVKHNAPELLEKKLQSKTWKAAPIMLSGNTDCYQPIEKEMQITRKLLKIFLKYKHPVGIVTKNALILRDLDIIKELNAYGLISVAISINTLNEELRQAMEPRTASAKKRMRVVQVLASHGIPVKVLAAPIVPGLNDEGLFTLVKVAAQHGARDINPIVVRLNGDVQKVFKDWARKNFPYRYQKIMRRIQSLHKGSLGSSEFGARMKGSGKWADNIHQQFAIAKRTYGMDKNPPFEYNRSLYDGTATPQMSLFPSQSMAV